VRIVLTSIIILEIIMTKKNITELDEISLLPKEGEPGYLPLDFVKEMKEMSEEARLRNINSIEELKKIIQRG
jgi:hypothetical protein